MTFLVATVNVVLGLVYTSYGVMTIIDLKRGWKTSGFSHFGLAWIAMAFTCGPHHLDHGIHVFAEGYGGPLDLFVVLVGFPAGVTWFLLRVEAILGRFVEDVERRAHLTLTLAAFAAFSVFYFFAGAPTLRRIPGGTRTVAFVAPLVASLFTVQRSRRTRERYLQERGAAKLLRNWPFADPPPPIERTIFGEWLDRAGRLVHYVLYALLVAVPVSGIVLQFARGDALPLFGLAEIVSPWTRDRAFARSVKEIHEVAANALLILAAFHAAAALVHHWVLRDRTLLRMLPRSRRS